MPLYIAGKILIPFGALFVFPSIRRFEETPMHRVFTRVAILVAVASLAAIAAAPLKAADYREEALNRIGALEKKFVTLSEAVPTDKYTWRPAEGVRSVSELFLHVAGANFGLPARILGMPAPAGFEGKGYDKSTTDKAQIVKAVKESFAHFRASIEKLEAADAEKMVKVFGGEACTRGAVLFLLEHLSEHLGQSIAYARVNGVTPPWSE
jgi:uncharacterized damage-inducible protein DinB